MNNYFIYRFVLPVLFLFLSFPLSAQERDSLTRKTLRKAGPKYIGIEMGIGRSSFRDLSTSPRFYNGVPVSSRLSFLKENEQRERQFNLRYLFGSFNSGGNYPNRAKMYHLLLDYSKIYAIDRWSEGKWNIKAGGTIATAGNVRVNPSLQNNSFGMEYFASLMGTVQVTRDLSRLQPSPHKLWFIHYGRKAKERSLSFRLNAGLLNLNYRNGFIYTQQYQVVNRLDIFENYELHLSGLWFGSALNFTRYFERGNAIRFSYNWNAYRTSYRFEGFEMAHHTFGFALLFRTK